MEKGFDSFFELHASMRNMSQEDLNNHGHEELEPGFHPYLTSIGESDSYLIVKEMTTREKHNRRGREPDSLRLRVVQTSDVTVERKRLWKKSEDVEIEEVNKEELWERVLGEPQGFFKASERGE